MESRHKNGLARRMIVALFDAGEPQGFARSHGAQSFGGKTFWLFQHGAIPDQQPVLSLCFPARNLAVGLPQQKLLNLLGLPPPVVN